jgi:hypothetical protein
VVLLNTQLYSYKILLIRNIRVVLVIRGRITRTLRILRITLCDLGYHSSSYSSTGSILDRACINQLASSDSSPSSRSIVLKASVTFCSLLFVY